jgi:hypothetical protein
MLQALQCAHSKACFRSVAITAFTNCLHAVALRSRLHCTQLCCANMCCAITLLLHAARAHTHQTVMQVEFALLFDLHGELIVVPGDPDLRGQTFDPAGIVNATLQNGIGYTRTGLLAASELVRFNCSKWNDRELQTTPKSALHPYDTGAEALVSSGSSVYSTLCVSSSSVW